MFMSLRLCPWRIILRNTEEKDDVYKNATHTDQCCLSVIKYKNFLSSSPTSIEISFHSTKYTSGLNLELFLFFNFFFSFKLSFFLCWNSLHIKNPLVHFNLLTSPNHHISYLIISSIIPQIWEMPFCWGLGWGVVRVRSFLQGLLLLFFLSTLFKGV